MLNGVQYKAEAINADFKGKQLYNYKCETFIKEANYKFGLFTTDVGLYECSCVAERWGKKKQKQGLFVCFEVRLCILFITFLATLYTISLLRCHSIFVYGLLRHL